MPGYTAGSGAELSTPDWIFVEHDHYAGGDLIDVQTSGGDHQISYDRYFDKFIGETSSFEVTAVLSGDVNHSYYVVPDAESPVLADYGTFIGLTNTATDETTTSAQTITQAIAGPAQGAAAGAGGGTTPTTDGGNDNFDVYILSESNVSAINGMLLTGTVTAGTAYMFDETDRDALLVEVELDGTTSETPDDYKVVNGGDAIGLPIEAGDDAINGIKFYLEGDPGGSPGLTPDGFVIYDSLIA
jgi:hypothetical protein